MPLSIGQSDAIEREPELDLKQEMLIYQILLTAGRAVGSGADSRRIREESGRGPPDTDLIYKPAGASPITRAPLRVDSCHGDPGWQSRSGRGWLMRDDQVE